MAAGAAAEFVDSLAIRKIGAEQVLLVDATPVGLELRLDRLGKPPEQPHRHVRPHIFRCQRIEIALAGDELLEVFTPALDPAGLVARNGDREFLAADAVEQSGHEIVECFALDPIIVPIALGDRVPTGRRQFLLRVAQKPREIGDGERMLGHHVEIGPLRCAVDRPMRVLDRPSCSASSERAATLDRLRRQRTWRRANRFHPPTIALSPFSRPIDLTRGQVNCNSAALHHIIAFSNPAPDRGKRPAGPGFRACAPDCRADNPRDFGPGQSQRTLGLTKP